MLSVRNASIVRSSLKTLQTTPSRDLIGKLNMRESYFVTTTYFHGGPNIAQVFCCPNDHWGWFLLDGMAIKICERLLSTRSKHNSIIFSQACRCWNVAKYPVIRKQNLFILLRQNSWCTLVAPYLTRIISSCCILTALLEEKSTGQ